jgi:serpin B
MGTDSVQEGKPFAPSRHVTGNMSLQGGMDVKDRSIASTLVGLVLAALFSTACRPAPGGQLVQADVPRLESPVVSDAQAAQLIAGNQAFAFELYRALAAGEEGNLIVSPYSISLAFSMLYGGARGEAEAELARVFHFLPQEAQHPAFNVVDQRLQGLGQARQSEAGGASFELNLANAVWGQRGYPFKEPYLDTLAAQYGAGLRVVDFSRAPETAREAINAWVTQETGKRIKEIAPPGSVSANTRLVLANAIYFKAGWDYPFQESATADGPFTLLDGSQVTVPLMHQEERLDYADGRTVSSDLLGPPGEGYQVVWLPYGGGTVDMWIILPAEGRFEEVQERLSADWIESLRRDAEARRVILTVPRFGFETSLELHNLFKEMGLMHTFCPAQDFEGMAEGGGLCVDYALHRATIAVDEQGTEAAAATMVAVPVEQVQDVEMTVDRPFLFAIVARETGAVLFMGRVLNPALGW